MNAVRFSRHLLLAIAAITALAACSSGTAQVTTLPPLPSAPARGCAVMTGADVQSALGVSLGPGESTPGTTDAPLGGCAYGKLGKTPVVDLLSYPTGLFNATDPGTTPVSGIGQTAWFLPRFSSTGSSVSVLYVQKGNTVLAISIEPDPASAKQPMAHWQALEEQLGRVAIARVE